MYFKCNNFSLVEEEHFILFPSNLTEFIRGCRFISIRLQDCTGTQCYFRPLGGSYKSHSETHYLWQARCR